MDFTDYQWRLTVMRQWQTARNTVVTPINDARDLTLPQLVRGVPPQGPFPLRERTRAFELQTRLSLMAMPIGFFAVGLAAAGRRPFVRALLCWGGSFGIWIVGFGSARIRYQMETTSAATAWTPLLMLLLMALLIALCRRRAGLVLS